MNCVGYNNKSLSFVLAVKVALEEVFLKNIAGLNNICRFNFGSRQNIRFCQEIFMFLCVNKFTIVIRSLRKGVSINWKAILLYIKPFL